VGTDLVEREVNEMRILRGLVGSLLWILAGLLGLVGVLLCATLILLPVGIPVLMLARRLFTYAMAVMVPRKVRHPVQELGKSTRRGAKDAKDALPAVDTKSMWKGARRTRKKGRSFVKQQRKRFA
jgi:hypothetical protein